MVGIASEVRGRSVTSAEATMAGRECVFEERLRERETDVYVRESLRDVRDIERDFEGETGTGRVRSLSRVIKT